MDKQKEARFNAIAKQIENESEVVKDCVSYDIDHCNKKYIDTIMTEWEEKEVNPKYKIGDMVIPKIHTQDGILEGFPVKIVGSVVYPDKNVFYQLKGLEHEDIPESEIIRKVS